MGILDKIGIGSAKDSTKKPEPKDKPKGGAEAKGEVKAAPKKDAKPKSPKVKPAAKSTAQKGSAYRHLVRPIISEKAAMLSASGKYVFAVSKNSNKNEIKKSIEQVYGVSVEGVNIVNIAGKFRRHGKGVGKTSDWKKAIVTVKKGEKISGIIESAQQ